MQVPSNKKSAPGPAAATVPDEQARRRSLDIAFALGLDGNRTPTKDSKEATALEVLRAVAAQEASKPAYSPAASNPMEMSVFAPEGRVGGSSKQITSLDNFGFGPEYLRKGFASQLELQNTFTAGIQFSQSFRESNSGEYPCPGTVVYLLEKCGEQVEQRTLTRTAGYKMLRTHFERDAKPADIVRLLLDYNIPLPELKKLSGKAISQTVKKLLYGDASQDEAAAAGVMRKLEDMADAELPFNRST